MSGGTRRDPDRVRPHVDFGATGVLPPDAQTSGGLLVAGEAPGAPVVGEPLPRDDHVPLVR